jgi:hypothetical protein
LVNHFLVFKTFNYDCPMSGALTLFVDMSYCSRHCKQVKRVGFLPESRKKGSGTEEADRGRKMDRGREPAEWARYAFL